MRSLIVVILVFFLLPITLSLFRVEGYYGSSVSVQPAKTERYIGSTNVGDTFAVNLTCGNMSDLAGYQYKFFWNSALLECIRVKDHLPFSGPFPFVAVNNTNYGNSTHGGFFFMVASMSGSVTGSFLLREITFRIREAPLSGVDYLYSGLTLFQTLFGDIYSNPIPHDVHNGEFYYYRQKILVDPATVERYMNDTFVGDTFQVSLTIANVGGLVGFEYKLYWNNSVLNFVDVKDSSPWNDSDTYVAWNITSNTYNVTHGWFFFSAISMSLQKFNGSLVIRRITFRIMSPPPMGEGKYLQSSLHLTDTILADADSNPIPHNVQDGQFIYHYVLNGIGVTNIVLQKTVLGLSWPPNGPPDRKNFTCLINVTVANIGLPTATFNVTLYANLTKISSVPITLENGYTTTIVFRWRASNNMFWYGSYIIRAVADFVPGDPNPADNTLVAPLRILVTIPGDCKGDRVVNVLDLILIAKHLGHVNGDDHIPCSEEWYRCMNSDVNCDGTHNVLDLILAASHGGESW